MRFTGTPFEKWSKPKQSKDLAFLSQFKKVALLLKTFRFSTINKITQKLPETASGWLPWSSFRPKRKEWSLSNLRWSLNRWLHQSNIYQSFINEHANSQFKIRSYLRLRFRVSSGILKMEDCSMSTARKLGDPMPRVKPGAAGWEAQTILFCYTSHLNKGQ